MLFDTRNFAAKITNNLVMHALELIGKVVDLTTYI